MVSFSKYLLRMLYLMISEHWEGVGQGNRK